jgi:hypothetical protein
VIESDRVIKENGKQENDVLTPPLLEKEKTWDVIIKVCYYVTIYSFHALCD